MSVVIRLARAGTKKRPVYHVVVADSRFPRDGRFIERLGHFNPLLPKDNAERLKLDMDKVKAWLAKGAQPSDRVTRFLDAAGVMTREKRNNPAERLVGRRHRGKSDQIGVVIFVVLGRRQFVPGDIEFDAVEPLNVVASFNALEGNDQMVVGLAGARQFKMASTVFGR